MAIALGVMALAFTHSSGSGTDVSLAAPWGPIALVAANLFVELEDMADVTVARRGVPKR